MSSVNHDDIAHLKIPLGNIRSATSNFDDYNMITYTSEFEKRYWGQLLWFDKSINICARRWLNIERDDEKEQQFWMEISLLSSLKHKNLVSLVGFCDENDEKIIIIKLETRHSLDNYLSDTMMLTWLRRLEICVGLGNALSYIHHDETRDFSIIHRNIDSEIVLLNDNWEAKLSGFELSMKVIASERHLSFDADKVWSTDGYTDPTYEKTKSAHHKSDIYSFGIVMFELLCGRKAVINNDQDNKYLAPLAILHYREEKLEDIVEWNLWKQIDQQSFKVFTEIAYDCLNEERLQRPNINEIVTKLKKALELARVNEHMMSLPSNEFAHLKVPLENILSATNNFVEQNAIAKSRFEKRYEGRLSLSGKLIDITAKRLNKERNDREQLFWMEISMLSTLKHKNLVSLVGFCDENDEKIIIYRNETARGMLHKKLSDSKSLTWVRRLKICVDLAHVLSYIHYDEPCNFSVIHRSIDSSRVLLNYGWEPMLSSFEYSMKIKGSQRHHSFHTNKLEYVNGYGDPTYLETKRVSHKSDIYSFGVVLFELLCGRLSIIDGDTNKYLVPLVATHYREKTLNEIIDWDLWKQMDSQSFNIFVETAYDCLNEEQLQRPNIDEIVMRLEKALDYQNAIMSLPINEFAHLKVPLKNILSATNNFAQENVMLEDWFEKRYRGELLWSGMSIHILARRFNKKWYDQEELFWMDISMLSSLKHRNLVSLVGFCDENDEKIIITKHETRGSLIDYLSDTMLLTWVRRLEICVGLAHALSYIHYDEPRNFSVIHRCIDSSRVLLNYGWEPKLHAFEYSMKIKASQRHHSFRTNTVWYVDGYGDPTYIETKRVNHKSDMYSFGMVLFELLCGRKSVSDDQDNMYLAPMAIFHYREKIMDEIIDPDLWKQMHPQSFDVFAEIAYDCLNEEQLRRPNIDEIVARLEKALELQLECENIEHSSVADEVGGTSSSYEQGSASHFTSTGDESNSSKKTMSSLKYLSHSLISGVDISNATNNFAPENIIREKPLKWVYQGRMFHSGQFIDIVARGIYREYRKDESKKFRMEKLMLSSLNHTNLVSVIGFSDEKIMITVYKKEANGSLNKYLGDQTLTWMQRLKICLGVANALSYIHYDAGRDFSVIHCNVRSSKILLDDKWEPKLSGFELSLKNSVARRHHLLHTRDIIENVYLDPKYKTTGGMTHKSDVYSFGVVLVEVLCGRSAALPDEALGQGLLSQLANSHLDDMIDQDLRNQMDQESLKIFSETAHCCIKEEREDRPHIDQVVKGLEKAVKLQLMYENPELQRNAADSTSSYHLLRWENLEHLKIRLKYIEMATEKFADKYLIGSGGYGMVYKAELTHFDSSSHLLEREGFTLFESVWWWLPNKKSDLPKKLSTVAIKRIINNREGEQGFIAEIDILTSCKHENIIPLLGFCDEDRDHMILVYELASKGGLEDYLGNSDKMINLTWMRRLKICLDIANGLNYIHTNTDKEKQKIIHRDIKSANILLGDNWVAKIADFGLSKLHPADQEASTLNINTIAGTNMYLDPEYQKFGRLVCGLVELTASFTNP